MTTQQIEAEAIISLWLAIHGGDPAPDGISQEVAGNAAWQIIGALAAYNGGVIAASKESALTTKILQNLDRVNLKFSLRDGSKIQEVTAKDSDILLRVGEGDQPPPTRCYCFSYQGSSYCYCYKLRPFTPTL